MPSTQCEGFSYPTHFLKSRDSVIRNKLLEYTRECMLAAVAKQSHLSEVGAQGKLPIDCSSLNTCNFVCGTMACAKMSLLWSVIHYQMTFEWNSGCGLETSIAMGQCGNMSEACCASR